MWQVVNVASSLQLLTWFLLADIVIDKHKWCGLTTPTVWNKLSVNSLIKNNMKVFLFHVVPYFYSVH
jgi:hypothetical protein